jgi:hypothetical protein
MNLIDVLNAITLLNWERMSYTLFCVCALVWLTQQVHDDVRLAMYSAMKGLATTTLYIVMFCVLAYVVHTYVDWRHITSTTFNAGFKAFVDGVFNPTKQDL